MSTIPVAISTGLMIIDVDQDPETGVSATDYGTYIDHDLGTEYVVLISVVGDGLIGKFKSTETYTLEGELFITTSGSALNYTNPL